MITLRPEVLELTLFRSKSSPTELQCIGVPKASSPLAVAAIERWLARARITEREPFMRRMLGHGEIGGRISGAGIALAVKAAVERHLRAKGVPAEVAWTIAQAFGGHSGRVGFVSSSHEAGATTLAIAALTRHKDASSVNRYARQANQLRTAPHKLDGVGV